MFHANHIGTIGAENLTSPHTSCGLETCGIARKIGIVGLDGAAVRGAGAHQGEAAEGRFRRFFALLQGFGASIASPGAGSGSA